jgi:DNA-binding IclR family transcriptional regulator
MSGGSSQPGGSVGSKISLILFALSDESRTLSEIAARSDLPLSTVHLQAYGRDAFGSQGEADLGIREVAVPIMEDLLRAVGVRVRVGYFDNELEVAYVQKDSLHEPVPRACAAARLPAHALAVGKALLAFSSSRAVDFVLARGLRRFTPFTLTKREQLHGVFKTIRATRLALCDRELEWDSCGVAAPVFGPDGRATAAIDLRTRDLTTDVAAFRPVLLMAAAGLSREIAQLPRSGRPA